MNPIIHVAFISTFKLDRFSLLAKHLQGCHILLDIIRPKSRNPLKVLRLMFAQPRQSVLMTHDWLRFAFLLALIKALRGNPLILILNSFILEARRISSARMLPSSFYRAAMRYALRQADAVVCNSHYLEEEYRQQFPKICDKFVTIYNGIEIPKEEPQELFHFPEIGYNLVTITNFEYPHKFIGLELLFQGMAHAALPNSRLYILGKVVSQKGERHLETFEREMRTKWAGMEFYILPNANVFAFLQPEKAYFMYSSGPHGDSLPRAILEAQALGMPTLVVDTNGCAEAVLPGESAIVVPPDAEALAQGLAHLVSAEFDRIHMRQAAVRHVQERFSWGKMAAAYTRLIQSLV